MQDIVTWSAWVRAEAANWLFALRTVLAMLLALLVAFRLDLSSPGSAAVTVAIIALPRTGMVLEKSFYRLLGTLLGTLVTLILVATFVQQRDTFIVAVALWIGLCTAGASWFRGFQAYGWLLCGYTTCLIGFPAFMDASHAFEIAVDRVTIVSVGILSAGVVNATLLPLRSTETLVQLIRRCYIDFVSFAELATRAGAAAQSNGAHHQFSRDVANLEATRASSIFEDPTSRVRNRRIFGFLGAFMRASSRLHLLRRQLDFLRDNDREVALSALEERLGAFRAALRVGSHVPESAYEASPVARQLSDIVNQTSKPADARLNSYTGALDWNSTLILFNEATQAARDFAEHYADMFPARSTANRARSARLPIGADPVLATLAGVRAAVAVVVCNVFWIASAWPEGYSMTLLGVVGCALFSSAPDPAAAALNMCKGLLLAIPALFVCYSLFLPAANDFYTLALALSPFLIFGAWLITRPGRSLMGGGFFMNFIPALSLAGLMQYDAVAVLNNAIASALGMLIAATCFAVINPGERSWRSNRARKLLLQSLRRAASDSLPGLRARFEIQNRDLTLSLVDVQKVRKDSTQDEILGLLVLEIGDAIIRMRLNTPADGANGEQIESVIRAAVAAVERQDVAALRALEPALLRLLSTAKQDAAASPADGSGNDDSILQRVISLNSLRGALAETAMFLSSRANASASDAT